MQTEIRSLLDCHVIGSDGQHIGKVGQVFLSDRTGEPEWVTVRTGMFGMRQTFVPLAGSRRSGGEIRAPFDKETIKGAPNVDVDDRLTLEEEASLYRYYGMQPSNIPAQRKPEGPAGMTAGTGKAMREGEREGQRGRERDGDIDMTRSEEHMHVGKERREAGHVRLRKYVESEDVEQTVPLAHDEVVIEREAVTDAGPMDGRIGEDEEVITLYEERPVVGTETTPVERVHVHKERVSREEKVRGKVRKEHLDVEQDQDGRPLDEGARRDRDTRGDR
ncbi:PRC and DUF2382 domain-containing protein [Nonomuraea sp. SBT364]|uniref:PRC and DUF2382 domain-containing protein n=1 Tax=Nonomuraea sp. SBT364 TaxID=1580530 RepID=UPI00066A2C2C|nr:PRC and DUF2382 domain-containing protein [Nonomuraea sp. SBT364]